MKTESLWCRRPTPPTSSRRRRTSITRSTQPFPSSRSSSRSRKLSPNSAESRLAWPGWLGGATFAQTSPSVLRRRREGGHEGGHPRRRKRRSQRIVRRLHIRRDAGSSAIGTESIPLLPELSARRSTDKETGTDRPDNGVTRQSDNVPFEQSRNVLLTAPSFGDARRTATDDASR